VSPRSRSNRRAIPGLLTFALVLLAALAVTAIVLGNTDNDRTEADGTTGAAATGGGAPVTTEGAVPSPGAVTDPNATATVPVDPNATATVPFDPNATATVPVDPNATAAPPVTSAPAGPLGGDLGLSVPMSQPACDGTWVAFVGSSSDPATIVSDITSLLNAHPGSQYTLTRGGCTSLRQALPDGRDIYAVYLGPFADQASACAAATQAGNGAYVKRVDDSTPPEQFWSC